ncbi:hypothetical protein ACHAXM_000376 [Skeletonema potamos]
MALHLRQALIKLLLVLLFAVACLNFFIVVENDDGGGVGVSKLLPAEISYLAETSSLLAKIANDAITIEAGHLNGSLYLPDALHPNENSIIRTNILQGKNPRCCLIASAPNKPKRIPCHGTCFLPRACTDELYPFQSSREQSFFHQLRNVTVENQRDAGRPRVVVGTESLDLQRKCQEMNARLHPPYQWCQHWLNCDNNRRNNHPINPYEANLPPPGCSLIPNMHSAYQNLLLFPSNTERREKIGGGATTTNNKLAFCGIPKNGITNWIQLLRFIIGAPDYLSVPHGKHDWKKFQFDSLDEHVQLNILNDDSYIFAAFLRDPAERLLSLYLDKVNGKDLLWKTHFVSLYGLDDTPSFEEFVKLIDRKRTSCPFYGNKSERISGMDWCTDEHWAPQTFNCGLSEFLPRFKFIGSLGRIEHQSKQILQHVGLWESYGRYYHEEKSVIPDRVRSSCAVPPPELKVGDTLTGFQQQQQQQQTKKAITPTKDQDGVKFSYHSTQSQSKLDKYYTKELHEIVARLYANDYKVWNLIKDEEDLVSGSELAMKLSSTCRVKAIH